MRPTRPANIDAGDSTSVGCGVLLMLFVWAVLGGACWLWSKGYW